jgi:hypothetical protein
MRVIASIVMSSNCGASAGAESLGDDPYSIILPYDAQGRLLLGTRGRGLFLYDGRTMTPFQAPARARRSAVSSARHRLADIQRVVGVLRAVEDPAGRLPHLHRAVGPSKEAGLVWKYTPSRETNRRQTSSKMRESGGSLSASETKRVSP